MAIFSPDLFGDPAPKKMLFHRDSVASRFLLLFFLLIPLTWLASGLAFSQPLDSRALLAWAERDDQGIYQMRLARHGDLAWSAPVLLTEGPNHAILPAVAVDDEGSIWVAWTELRGVNGLIRYRFFKDGQWSAPAYLETATTSDLAPTLGVDDNGGVWLAYSGSDGQQDDVFTARWRENGWSTPLKVHPDNETPDILPGLAKGPDGRLALCWQGFDLLAREYRTASSVLTSTGWSLPAMAATPDSCPDQEVFATGLGFDEEPVWARPPGFLRDASQAILRLGNGRIINLRGKGR